MTRNITIQGPSRRAIGARATFALAAALVLALSPAARPAQAQDAGSATVFGPNFDLESVLAREGQVVFLPWQDYEELRDFGKKPTVELVPPFAWAYGAATYDLAAGEQSATCRATYEVNVLEEGWHQVPVPGGDVVFRGATLDGHETFLAPVLAGPVPAQDAQASNAQPQMQPNAMPQQALANQNQAQQQVQVGIFQSPYRLPPVFPGQAQAIANANAMQNVGQGAAMQPTMGPGTTYTGSYAVSVPTTGPHTLVVEMVVPVAESGGAGGRALGVAIPRTPSASVSASLPVTDASIQVGAGIGRTTSREGDRTRVTYLLPPCDRLDLSWTGHVEEHAVEEAGTTPAPEPEAPPRVDGEVHAAYHVNEDFVSARAAVYFSIRQGQTSSFSIKLPPGAELTDLTDALTHRSVRPDETKDPDGTTYRVTLDAPVRGQRRYVVEFDRRIGTPGEGPGEGKTEGKPAGKPDAAADAAVKIDLPLLELPGTEVERGDVVLTRSPEIDVTASRQERVTQVTGADLPRDPILREGSSSDLCFHYAMHHPALALDVRPLHPPTQISCEVERELGQTVVTDEGMAFTRLRYSIHNTGQKYLEVLIPDMGPEGARTPATVLSVLSGGEPIKPGERDTAGEKGYRTLVLPLKLGLQNAPAVFELELVYAGPVSLPLTAWGHFEVPLPRTRAQSDVKLRIDQLVWVVDCPADTRVHDFKTAMAPLEEGPGDDDLTSRPQRGGDASLGQAPPPANALANVLRNLRQGVTGIQPVVVDWPAVRRGPHTRGQFRVPTPGDGQAFAIDVRYCSASWAMAGHTIVFLLVGISLALGALMGILWAWAIFPIVAVVGGWMAGGHAVWMAILAVVLLGLVKLVISPAQERTSP